MTRDRRPKAEAEGIHNDSVRSRLSATHSSHSLARSGPNGNLTAPGAAGTPGAAVRLPLTLLAMVLLLSPVASRQLTAVRVSAGPGLSAGVCAARTGGGLLPQRRRPLPREFL